MPNPSRLVVFKPLWNHGGHEDPSASGGSSHHLSCCNDAEQGRKQEAAPSWEDICGKREQVSLQIQTFTASHPEEAFSLEAVLNWSLAVSEIKADLPAYMAMLLMQVLMPWAQTEEDRKSVV